MSNHATGKFKIEKWDEKPYLEVEGGPKLVQANVTQSFAGDFVGESQIIYLMVYPPEGVVTFIGLEHFAGRLGGRAGSFALQHNGTFKDEVATSTYSVVPGSGAGELRGLSGQGSYGAQHGVGEVAYTFEYELG